MKHDLTTGTWQDDTGTGCPIRIILVSTSDDGGKQNTMVMMFVERVVLLLTELSVPFLP